MSNISSRVSRFLGFVLDALAAVFSHTKAAESVLTKNYEEHVNALLQYFELDLGGDQDRQREFFKQVWPPFLLLVIELLNLKNLLFF